MEAASARCDVAVTLAHASAAAGCALNATGPTLSESPRAERVHVACSVTL